MVIPIPGGLGAPLAGPPTPELQPVFKKIKICVLAMLGCTALKLVAGLLLGEVFQVFFASMNIIINTVIGIFLLKDDPQMARMADCLVKTFCQQCADQLRGGMSCLLFFTICNAVTVFVDFLGGDVYQLFAIILPIAMRPDQWPNDFFGVGVAIFFVAGIGAVIAQFMGAWYGMKAYEQASAAVTGVEGGDGSYVPPTYQPSGSARPAQQAPRQQGFMGGGGAAGRDQGFKPFSGPGQRLGGN